MSDIPQFGFKAEELINNGRTTRANIEETRKWLSSRPEIPQMSDEQIALFLIACNNVVDATETTIECYFKHKASAPEIFRDRDIDLEEVQFTFGVSSIALLPKRTKENYALLMSSVKDTYYYNFAFPQQFKACTTVIDHALYSNPPNGLVVIINMKGFLLISRSFAVIPTRTEDNCVVMMASLKDTSYTAFSFAAHVKLAFLMIDFVLQSDPPKGVIGIVNMTGVGLMHLTRLKIDTTKKLISYLQEGMPTQLRQVHILNSSYVFDKILFILKPFMKRELFESIITHPVGTPMAEFFEKYVPAGCMPCDFGGELPTLEQLSQDFQKDCRKLKTFLEADQRQVQRYKDNLERC